MHQNGASYFYTHGSWNVVHSVEVSPQEFASVLKASDGIPVKYVPKLSK